MSDDIKLVYTGSRAEGLFLTELLKENGIGAIYKDRLGSSLQAGWADGAPGDAVQIYVETENLEKAKAFLDEYFKTRDKKA
jgi:hypothetical protein